MAETPSLNLAHYELRETMFNEMIGVYHTFPANRSVLIKELEHYEMNFRCEELTSYESMKDAKSDLIVIFSPEFVPSKMDATDIKEILRKLNKTLIIVAYDMAVWTMNRSRIFYLQQRDDRQTMIDVKTIIAMELLSRPKDNMLVESVE